MFSRLLSRILLLSALAAAAYSIALVVTPSADTVQTGDSLSPGFRAGLNRVVFSSGNAQLAGNLHLPRDYKPGRRYPTVILAGSWTSVKEQMPERYAPELAQAGYAALTFDFRGYGQSEGRPRDLESPALKVADIRSAVDYVKGLPVAAPHRVALLGICAGAGYAAAEAAGDPRVNALVLIAPWLHDASILQNVYASRGESGAHNGYAALLGAGNAARRRFEASGEVDYAPAASAVDEQAAMYAPASVLDYYFNARRGAVPQWTNRFAVMGWSEWLTFDAIAYAPKINQPTLLVHSEKAAIPEGVRKFERVLTAPSESVWLDHATQFSFYDDPETVKRASEEAVRFLKQVLPSR